MSHWSDIAEWRGPTENQGPAMIEWRGLVVHIAEGSYEGTISWCKNPTSDVSCHFVAAADGRLAQLIDTDVAAWTQRAGNGHWLSVENEGFTPGALTPAQLLSCAKILAKAHQVYGVPLQVAIDPNGRGLGHHSMGTNGGSVPTDTWTGPTWGHEDCPGPAIVAQKQTIVNMAISIIGGVIPPPPPEDDVQQQQINWLYNMGGITYAMSQGLDEVDQVDPDTGNPAIPGAAGGHHTLSLAPYWERVAKPGPVGPAGPPGTPGIGANHVHLVGPVGTGTAEPPV